jgi:hypothetical protein
LPLAFGGFEAAHQWALDWRSAVRPKEAKHRAAVMKGIERHTAASEACILILHVLYISRGPALLVTYTTRRV